MKVLIISINRETSPYPVVPIGALCVARAIKEAGHDPKLLDLCFVENDRQAIEDCLAEFSADCIGISIRNIDNTNQQNSKNYIPRTRKIVDCLRRCSQVPIVLGGSGYSVFPEQLLEELGADFGIAGPGEASLVSLLQSMEQKTPVAGVPGVYYLKNNEVQHNDPVQQPGFYRPWLEGIDLDSYLKQGSLMGIQTKRGCPFKCSYCTYPKINGSRVTLLGAEKVVEQLRYYSQEKGIFDFFFVDDVFNIPYSSTIELCKEIIKKNLKIRWYAFCSPREFDEPLAELLVAAGCQGVEFGTDAGHAKTLRGHGKDFSPDDILRAGLACKKAKLAQCHYIIFGGPNETDETAAATIELMQKISPTMVLPFIGTRIYEDTKLAEIALSEGQISQDQNFLQSVYYRSKNFDAVQLHQRLQDLEQESLHWLLIEGAKVFAWENLRQYVQNGYHGPFWDLMHRPTRLAFSKLPSNQG